MVVGDVGDPGGPAAASGDEVESEAAAGTRMRRPIWLAILATMVAFLAIYGVWNRQTSHADRDRSAESPGDQLQAATAEGTSLAAVGRASGLDSPCTVWLLDVDAPEKANAYAVTAGTCVGVADPTSILTAEPVEGATAAFRVFAPPTAGARAEVVEAPIDEVVWASVRGTDLAVLRLGATYGDLAAEGIRPIRPVDVLPQDAQILVAGVPVEGIAASEQYLRGSRCQVGPTTDVLEDSLLWHDLQSSTCRGILDGSQGSAVLNQVGEAVGMVNTSTIGAEEGQDCVQGRPCEVSPGGVTFAENHSYMVPVDALAGCFPEGEFALGAQCDLEDPTTVVVADISTTVASPGASVQVQFEDRNPNAAEAELKSGPLGEIDCRDLVGWELARPPYAVTMPMQEGFALVCVGSSDQPTEIVVRVDTSAPDPATIELLQTPTEGGVLVEPVVDPPDLVGFRWVSGPKGAMDCANAEGYTLYQGTPALVQAADMPSTVCVIGIDEAGNESAPSSHDVE